MNSTTGQMPMTAGTVSKQRRCFFILTALALLIVLVPTTGRSQFLRAGVAVREIPTAAGMQMDAFPGREGRTVIPRVAEGTHDPMMVKSVVLEEGETLLALTSCDMVLLLPPVIERAKALVTAETPLRAEHILIAATHVHHSPALGDLFGIPPQTEFRESLAQAIAASIIEAYGKRRPARMGAGRGFVDLSYNRRFINHIDYHSIVGIDSGLVMRIPMGINIDIHGGIVVTVLKAEIGPEIQPRGNP